MLRQNPKQRAENIKNYATGYDKRQEKIKKNGFRKGAEKYKMPMNREKVEKHTNS